MDEDKVLISAPKNTMHTQTRYRRSTDVSEQRP
jgi:hypothetical protein